MLVAGVTILVTAIPSAPGYVGTYELAATAVATSLGVDPDAAFALAVLVHVTTLCRWLSVGPSPWPRWAVACAATRPAPSSSSGPRSGRPPRADTSRERRLLNGGASWHQGRWSGVVRSGPVRYGGGALISGDAAPCRRAACRHRRARIDGRGSSAPAGGAPAGVRVDPRPRRVLPATNGTGRRGAAVRIQETTVFSGLSNPTASRFAPRRPGLRRGEERPHQGLRQPHRHDADGLRRPAHRRSTTTGTAGLLGPRAATRTSRPTPYVYVLYTYDAPIGGTAPTLGNAPARRPTRAPTRPARRRRLRRQRPAVAARRPSGNAMTGSEQVLIDDWCQQYPSHSIGDLAFGADGALYVSARRRRRASTSPTTARTGFRRTRAATRRRRSAATQTPPDAPRAARCARRTCARAADPRDARRQRSCARPATGAGAAGQSPFGQRRRQRAPHHRATASATRSG